MSDGADLRHDEEYVQMKSRWIIALWLALWALAGTPGDAWASDEPPAMSGIRLLGARDGAKVYSDGNLVAALPQSGPIPLSPGMHKLRVLQLGFAPFEQDVRVLPGRILTLEVELQPIAGVVRITTEPPGASVYVDADNVGQAPLEVEVRTGPHTLSARMPGYYPESFSLPISAGALIEHTLHLKPLPEDVNPNRPVQIRVRPWYERWWAWVLIIGGTAALTTAIAVPAVLATRSTCDKLGAEVCFPIGTTPGALQNSPSGLGLRVTF